MEGFLHKSYFIKKGKVIITYAKKSFSLVELAIVVMIAGVLSMVVIAGGMKLPTYAKSVSVINEISSYRQAINTFYNSIGGENNETRYLPGDFPNAQYQLAPSGYQSYTNSQISGLSNAVYSTIPLNGDGNGAVNATITCSSNVCSSEAFGVWSHLGAYGIIGKKYSNVCNSIRSNARNTCIKTDYNLPSVSNGEKNAVYTFFKPDLTNTMQKQIFGMFSDDKSFVNSHVLIMSDISYDKIYKSISTIGSYAFGGGGALRADLMMMIDDKIDDGLPLTGNVLGINGTGTKGACNNYEKDGTSFVAYGKNTEKSKIKYRNAGSNACIGAIVFGEFN